MSDLTLAPTRPRRVPDREPVTALISVEQDRARSTFWDELWRARSDRFLDVTYEVRLHVEDGTWTCRCPGHTTHGHCKHVARCKRRRLVSWWHALWLGLGPAELRAERDRILRFHAEGFAPTEDDWCALDALELLLPHAAERTDKEVA